MGIYDIIGILTILLATAALIFWNVRHQKNSAPPIKMFRSDDEEMNNAIRQAQDTLEQFLTVLQAPKPNQTDFEIKVHYDLSGDGGEHIWVNNLHFEDGQIHGLLYNDPVAILEYSFGDPITVYPNAITDWKYMEDGKLVGGYTIRVIFKHLTPAEHEDFSETMGYRLY